MIEKDYWRSLNELAKTEEFQSFLEQEFPDGVEGPPGSVERRRFLQLMGASFALAGLGGCRWPEEKILPFSRRSEDFVPGQAKHYATAMDLAGEAIGLLVTTRDGRPVKIEGNAQHPFTRGGTNTYAQASILELYDPDRSQRFIRREGASAQSASREQFDAFIAKLTQDLAQTGGDGLRVLSGHIASPTLGRLKDALLSKYPRARWFEYESLTTDHGRDGTRLVFGEPVRPIFDLDRAEIVLAADADILGTEPGALAMVSAWGRRRRPEIGPLLRLYSVESRLSSTGAQADHRLALRFSDVGPFLAALTVEVMGALGKEPPWSPSKARTLEVPKVGRWLKAVAKDLTERPGRAVVIPGYRQPPAVHALAHHLNALLGSIGSTVTYTREPNPNRPSHCAAITDLAKDLESGQGKTLVMLGSNPVHQAPGDLDFGALVAKAPTSIHVGLYGDETAAKSTWHVPEAHFLERWGDTRAHDGTISIVQPLIKPLFGGLSPIEISAMLVGWPPDGRQHVLATFEQSLASIGRANAEIGRTEAARADESTGLAHEASVREGGVSTTLAGQPGAGLITVGQAKDTALGVARPSSPAPSSPAPSSPASSSPASSNVSPLVAATLPGYRPWTDLERAWQTALHDGFLAGSAFPTVHVTPSTPALAEKDLAGGNERELEVSFFDDQKLHDGRFANNAWLQELPEFTTKLTWDNALLLSPATAADLGVTDESMVRVDSGPDSIDLPVLIVPGLPNQSASIAVGYGRSAAGLVGGSSEGGVPATGFDVRALRRSDSPFLAATKITRTDRRYSLASTQDHFAIDDLGKEEIEKRAPRLVREASETAYRKDPGAIRALDHHPPLTSLFDEHKGDGHRWGLVVDLSACVGCNACVVACQSENNVPVVGKAEVKRGREMHWLRIDRYFKGPPDDPEVAVQPVACVQCENAPCEQVCPVAATVHSAEGLNDMVYNRCIGTRYCSNNCPYKVRRFNFFNYHLDLKEPKNKVKLMVFNPEVTVRARGVMEKCTYCVQRIQAAKHFTRLEGRPIMDGDITPACAAACPSQAIVFGDLADPNSRVSKAQALARSYAMLADLNVKPRTQFLARIRNPNPALEGV